MPRLDELAAQLKQQRRDLERRMDESTTSKSETESILAKIEELRTRAEATRKVFIEPPPRTPKR